MYCYGTSYSTWIPPYTSSSAIATKSYTKSCACFEGIDRAARVSAKTLWLYGRWCNGRMVQGASSLFAELAKQS
jgi:hypothetical protein